jgi:hypothetical protein
VKRKFRKHKKRKVAEAILGGNRETAGKLERR